MKSLSPQVCPECINVGHVENHPPPVSYGRALLQIKNRALDVLGAERRETSIFAPVDNLHAQNIPVEPHRVLHVRNSKSNRRNLFNRHLHASSLPRQINPLMDSPYPKAILKSLRGPSKTHHTRSSTHSQCNLYAVGTHITMYTPQCYGSVT